MYRTNSSDEDNDAIVSISTLAKKDAFAACSLVFMSVLTSGDGSNFESASIPKKIETKKQRKNVGRERGRPFVANVVSPFESASASF